MNLLLYIYIFLIGITFGSFFTLAVYRIPRGEDIIQGHIAQNATINYHSGI